MTENDQKFEHDIVCNHYLMVSSMTPPFEVGGRMIHFCSKECLNIYQLNPENYSFESEEYENGN